MKKFIFFLRAYNDFDHLAPLIWKCLEKGDQPTLLITTELKIENDYRFKLINSSENIKVIYDVDRAYETHFKAKSFFERLKRKLYSYRRDHKSLIGKVYRHFFFNITDQIDFLRKERFDACIFEWSTPYARGDNIEKYFVASKALGIKTFALPHGCNIFVNNDVTYGYRESLSRGRFVDQSTTSLFDYYIFQNPIRRDGWVQWGFDPNKTQAWGSLRFYPEWAKKNLAACPKFTSEERNNNKLNIVFMQFQKEYNIDNKEVLNFLKDISNVKDISLVVKDATREGKSFYNRSQESNQLGSSLVSWVGNEVHSPALIAWSDLVIVIGGSIGIEAMLQDKPVLYPSFLSTNQTLYEKYNAAFCTSSSRESMQLIETMKDKNIGVPPGVDLMIKEIVYAGKEEFDVLEKYHSEISSKTLNYLEN